MEGNTAECRELYKDAQLAIDSLPKEKHPLIRDEKMNPAKVAGDAFANNEEYNEFDWVEKERVMYNKEPTHEKGDVQASKS
eukprot:8316691-Ditylum_brightwellii.AAC.1